MLIETILALVIGIIAGTFTGLFPGIHINLIASILLFSLDKFESVPLISLAIFVVAMSITHTFLDFIPSVYLGAPEEDTFLSVMPGHKMLKKGRGHEAVVITLYGSLAALLIILIFTPLFIWFLPSFYIIIKAIIPFILIFISAYLILREENFLRSSLVFILAGFLGFLTFNLPVKEPLLPLLTGLFGASGLIISLAEKTSIPKQEIPQLREIKIKSKTLIKSLIAVIISAPLCSFLPGIGSGHAATLGSEIIPQKTKGFLFLVGSINTIIMALSFVTVYAIGKARSGSASTVQNILKTISASDLMIIMITIIVAGIISFVMGVFLSKLCARHIGKVNYKYLTITTICILIGINIIFSNWLGLLVLATATALGIFAIRSTTRRINLMGSLILPSIIYYLT